MNGQIIVFVTLAAALYMFVRGTFRYDVVALMALLALVLTGVVSETDAFLGFGHPAVVTVAAVLIISRGLFLSGFVDLVAQQLLRIGLRPTLQVFSLTGVVAVLSAFMNNVGALALMMPVAIQLARRSQRPSSEVLMPLAFGSLLGGLMTMIGTPPNIIVATFREERRMEAFGFFDFTPVGLGIAVLGVLFVSLIGWRFIPKRRGLADAEELFEIEDYVTEVAIPEESRLAGKTLRHLWELADGDWQILGILRGDERLPALGRSRIMRPGDVLIVRAPSEPLLELVDRGDLELAARRPLHEEVLGAENMSLMEVVVAPGSSLEGKTAQSANLRTAHGINLLAVARQGARLRARLGTIRLRAGDVLLLQGPKDSLPETLQTLRCLPLAERGLSLGRPRRMMLALGLFAAAIGSVTIGLVSAPVAFVAVAGAMVLLRLITLQEVYDSVEWPVIILLGALIPVGEALERTGGADTIADVVLAVGAGFTPAVTVAIVFIATQFLSDVINNAAAAILMAPIAITLAEQFGASADPFLMAVAVAASSSFLTPIGHQSNTLVMGPGGYHFGDYWRLGLPLQMLVAVSGIALILRFWPL